MPHAPQSLEGQVAVITGAGAVSVAAYAVELAGRGAKIVVNDVDPRYADETVALVTGAGGGAVASYDDVGTPEGGTLLIDGALHQFGRLDIVINNAAILRGGYFEDLSLSDIDTVLRVDLASAFYVTQPAWRTLKEQGYGRVVMTSSSSGVFAHQGGANYAAAKAGHYGLMKALAFEGMDFGVTVNAVLPWATTTITQGRPTPGHAESWRRFGGPDLPMDDPRRSTAMVAHLVAFLVSPSCTVTGEAFSVCRGRYGRVFVGVADGWSAEPAPTVSAEQVAAHFDQIRDVSRHSVPMWVFDEVNNVMARLPPGDAAGS